jgi:hypothetical protein
MSEALQTIKAGTSFALGHDGDEDRRPFVSVARQYGSTLYPIPPWVVYVVSYDRGVLMASQQTFHDQAAALRYGWKRLETMRESGEWFCRCPEPSNGSGVKACGRCGEERPSAEHHGEEKT